MAMSAQVETQQAAEGCDDTPDGVVAEINITPLTDVFLVLLIIFMVASTAMTDGKLAALTGVEVAPPRSDVAAPVRTRADPVLTVTKNGDVYLDRTKVAMSELEGSLRKALAAGASRTVLLRSDTKTEFGAVVQAMTLATKAGGRIQVVTSPGAN